MSILGTVIYLITNHIIEIQYNNGGNGVGNGLLAIQGTGDCNNSTKTNEDHKACIKSDMQYYDLEGIGGSNYWKTGYDGKLTGADQNEKSNFLKIGSGEKFRELCTKGIDELIKKNKGEELSRSVNTTSSSNGGNLVPGSNVAYEHCLKGKSSTTSATK